MDGIRIYEGNLYKSNTLKTIMPKRVTKTSTKKSAPKKKIETQIVENLIELQKVHTNLAQKFDKLSGEISQLLALFETAAKSFANTPAAQGASKDQEFLEKIDKLLEQNKTIAKGLTLMEGKVRERMYTPEPAQAPQQADPNRPLPRF